MNDTQLDAILKQMAAADDPKLPAAGQIWFRAEIQRKARQRKRIERPLSVMRGIAAAVCLAAVVALALWNLAELRQMFGGSLMFPLVLSAVAVLTSLVFALSIMEFRRQHK